MFQLVNLHQYRRYIDILQKHYVSRGNNIL